MPREFQGAFAGGPVGLRVPLEQGTFSKNKHHLVSFQKNIFPTNLSSLECQTRLRLESAAGAGYCVVRGAGRRPAPCQGKFGGPLRGVRWGLRVPLERGVCFKNGHDLVSYNNNVFNKFVISRVPGKSPALVDRWGWVVCYRGAWRRPSPCHGKFGRPLREARWGSKSFSSGVRFLITNII